MNNVLFCYLFRSKRNSVIAGIEFGWGAMGSTIGMPIKAYPQGEEYLREARDAYEQSWSLYEKTGDYDSSVGKFLEDHPGYEARLALFKSPEERLKRFLVDEIWNIYNDMPKVNRDEVKDQLGDLFYTAFLSKETRSYDEIPLDEMSYWLKVMGGDPPGEFHWDSERHPLILTNSETAHRLQVFYDNRERIFGYNQLIWPLQKQYFDLEKDARKDFLVQYPILKSYWDYRRDFMLRNPDLMDYIEDDPENQPKYETLEELRSAYMNQPNFTPDEMITIMGEPLYYLVLSGDELPPIAMEKLEELEEVYGVNFEDMLTQVVR